MQHDNSDAPEFTDEQLRVALRRMGREARQLAFAAGHPVIILRGRALVALHPDGTQEIVESLEVAENARESVAT